MHRTTLRLALTLLLLAAALPATVRGQSRGWDVSLTDGRVLDDATLLAVENDTLRLVTVTTTGWQSDDRVDTVAVAAASVIGLERAGGWNFLTGAGVGFGIGAGVGATAVTASLGGSDYAALGYAVYPPIGAAAGIILGGIIGSFVDDDTSIDLSRRTPSARAGTIAWLIQSESYAR